MKKRAPRPSKTKIIEQLKDLQRELLRNPKLHGVLSETMTRLNINPGNYYYYASKCGGHEKFMEYDLDIFLTNRASKGCRVITFIDESTFLAVCANSKVSNSPIRNNLVDLGEEKLKEFVRLFNQGMPVRKIIEQLKLPRNRITRLLNSYIGATQALLSPPTNEIRGKTTSEMQELKERIEVLEMQVKALTTIINKGKNKCP